MNHSVASSPAPCEQSPRRADEFYHKLARKASMLHLKTPPPNQQTLQRMEHYSASAMGSDLANFGIFASGSSLDERTEEKQLHNLGKYYSEHNRRIANSSGKKLNFVQRQFTVAEMLHPNNNSPSGSVHSISHRKHDRPPIDIFQGKKFRLIADGQEEDSLLPSHN